jgi:hypothetical protein
MPIQRKVDSDGKPYYFNKGSNSHRYYYIAGNKNSRDLAYIKAERQLRAIHVSENRLR